MKLTTSVSVPKSDVNLSHQEPILLIGSCFAQNIGEKLLVNKFDVIINPNGIIYNPISLVRALARVFKNHVYSENELFQHAEKWISFNHHGSFSSFDKSECLDQINAPLKEAYQQLKETKSLFITFGSAWVYEYPEVGIVANCHKIPNKQFTKRLLSVKEILNAFEEIKDDLKEFNMVFTVSPVRHTKDGLHENNLSKATLHLAINNLVEQNNNYHYFPAYELVIDELRDYRFYKDDLVHPTELATNYVWEKFSDYYFNNEARQLNAKIQELKTAVNHKPFDFKSGQHQQFITKQVQQMDELAKQYPFLDFNEEKIKLKVD